MFNQQRQKDLSVRHEGKTAIESLYSLTLFCGSDAEFMMLFKVPEIIFFRQIGTTELHVKFMKQSPTVQQPLKSAY